MPWYRMPDGTNVHINFGHAGNKKAPRPCGARRPDATICAQISGYQCDWILPNACTCDRYLCEMHAFEVAGEKHLCPQHVESYRTWIRDQGIAY